MSASAPALAQSIYKCKGPDGRITYSSQPCAGEVETLTKSGTPKPPPQQKSAEPKAPPPTPDAAAKAAGASGQKCDNSAALRSVVARLDSPNTPEDVRSFLADERLRLLRCEFTRFTPEEMREREQAMADLNSSDTERRKAAITRMEMIYDRSMTPADRAARLNKPQK
jgi:hypothetical protein